MSDDSGLEAGYHICREALLDPISDNSWGIGRRPKVSRTARYNPQKRALASARHSSRRRAAAWRAKKAIFAVGKPHKHQSEHQIRDELGTSLLSSSLCSSVSDILVENWSKFEAVGTAPAQLGYSERTRSTLHAKPLRPSLSVPEPDLGSASEAALPFEDRFKHRNRRRASVLRIETLDPDGHPGLFFDYKSFFPANSGYDRTLCTPEADKVISRYRAKSEHLSRNGRKRTLRPGDIRPEPKQCHIPRSSTNNLDQDDSDGWQSSLLELEFWLSTSSSNKSCHEEGNILPQEGDNPEALKILKRKEVLAADDPICAPTEDIFSSLFAQAKLNPAIVLTGELDFAKSTLGTRIERTYMMESKNSEKNRSSSSLNPAKTKFSGIESGYKCGSRTFENDVLNGLTFASSLPRKRSHFDGTCDQSHCAKRQKTDKHADGHFEDHTKRFGSRMLEKMGFRGRLGAREQGIVTPLESKVLSGRVGLGVTQDKNLGHIVNDENLNVVSDKDLCSSLASPGIVEVVKRFSKTGHGSASLKKRKPSRELSRHSSSNENEDIVSARCLKRGDRSILQSENLKWADAHHKFIESETNTTKLDENGDYETDDKADNDGFDSGRRALLIEFDVLVKHSWDRRIQAFSKAFSDIPGIPSEPSPVEVLVRNGCDLSDEEAIRQIVSAHEIELSDEECDTILARIDLAYSELATPTPNLTVVNGLKSVSQELHIGVIHRGTRARLLSELKHLQLSNSFISGGTMVIDHRDTSPYLKSWKELLCRLGVSGRQSVFVASDCGMCRVPSTVIAGRILGARIAVSVDTGSFVSGAHDVNGGALQHTRNLQDILDASYVEVDTMFEVQENIRDRLRALAPKYQCKRVLALYETDGLWHAARAILELVENCSDEKNVFVEYCKWQNLEWVDTKNVVPLSRLEYHSLEAAGFPGLLDHADVSELT